MRGKGRGRDVPTFWLRGVIPLPKNATLGGAGTTLCANPKVGVQHSVLSFRFQYIGFRFQVFKFWVFGSGFWGCGVGLF